MRDEIVKEMRLVKRKAIADGSFMKTPYGGESLLTEEEWLLCRTRSFRDGFGMWERDLLTAEILKNGINSLSLQLLKKICDYGQGGERINDRIPLDNRIPERVSSGILRKGNSFCRRNVEASLVLRGSGGTDSTVSPSEDYDRQVAFTPGQEGSLFDYRGICRRQREDKYTGILHRDADIFCRQRR